MADITLIQGAITGLKTATDIAKGFLDLKSMAEVQGKVIELQAAILSAQSSALAAQSDQAAMADEIRSLKQEISRVKAWEETKQRYHLHEPTQGTFVYALKEEYKGADPMHWICTKCYDDGSRSILQLKTVGVEHNHYACPKCKSEIKVRGTRPRPQVDMRGPRY
jgi:Zn finger protein HypA/HybF involved in hydrogenase expression